MIWNTVLNVHDYFFQAIAFVVFVLFHPTSIFVITNCWGFSSWASSDLVLFVIDNAQTVFQARLKSFEIILLLVINLEIFPMLFLCYFSQDTFAKISQMH